MHKIRKLLDVQPSVEISVPKEIEAGKDIDQILAEIEGHTEIDQWLQEKPVMDDFDRKMKSYLQTEALQHFPQSHAKKIKKRNDTMKHVDLGDFSVTSSMQDINQMDYGEPPIIYGAVDHLHTTSLSQKRHQLIGNISTQYHNLNRKAILPLTGYMSKADTLVMMTKNTHNPAVMKDNDFSDQRMDTHRIVDRRKPESERGITKFIDSELDSNGGNQVRIAKKEENPERSASRISQHSQQNWEGRMSRIESEYHERKNSSSIRPSTHTDQESGKFSTSFQKIQERSHSRISGVVNLPIFDHLPCVAEEGISRIEE